MNNLGYCCINLTLQKKNKITTNRTMRQATFLDRGISYCSELALLNCKDLYKILEWNSQNNVNLFRISSNLFPWNSEYALEDLPDFLEISNILKSCGHLATQSKQRLIFHPDHFVKLASESDKTKKNSIHDLEVHSKIFDLMGFVPSFHNPINIHVGCKLTKDSIQRFLTSVELLSENVMKRLVIENDDKAAMFSVKDLYENIHKQTGIPITFDYHHHKFHDSSLTEEAAFHLANSTWVTHKPVFHYSSSRLIETPGVNPRAHADYIHENISTYNSDIDIELEAKAKELALLQYWRNKQHV
jgi:UV DNA damage endonuclease